jgi:hypothetical protein
MPHPDGSAGTTADSAGGRPPVSTPVSVTARTTTQPHWVSTIIAALSTAIRTPPVRDRLTVPYTVVATRDSATTSSSCSTSAGTATSAAAAPSRAP